MCVCVYVSVCVYVCVCVCENFEHTKVTSGFLKWNTFNFEERKKKSFFIFCFIFSFENSIFYIPEDSQMDRYIGNVYISNASFEYYIFHNLYLHTVGFISSFSYIYIYSENLIYIYEDH